MHTWKAHLLTFVWLDELDIQQPPTVQNALYHFDVTKGHLYQKYEMVHLKMFQESKYDKGELETYIRF